GPLPAAVAAPGSNPLAKPTAEFKCTCLPSCRDNFAMSRPWLSKCNVLEDRSSEQHNFLRDDADIFPECRKSIVADAPPVNQDVALLDLVEPQQQVNDC